MAKQVVEALTKEISPFTAPLGALGYLMRRPSLWFWAALPVLINLLIFALIFSLGWWYLRPELLSLISLDSEWMNTALRWLAGFFITLIVIAFAGLMTFVLMGPVGAPFIDYMTEIIEKEELRSRPRLIVTPPSLRDGAVHAIKEALRRLKFQLPLTLLVIVTSFVPAVGPFLAAMLGWLLATFFLPFDAFSYAMDRRKMSFSEKMDYYRGHRRQWTVFGFGLALLLLIPCNILWFPPIAAIAATRLYCERLLRERNGEGQDSGLHLE